MTKAESEQTSQSNDASLEVTQNIPENNGLLSPEAVAELRGRFDRAKQSEGEPEVIDVAFETLDSETQEQIATLEQEFAEATDALDAEAAKSRLELLQEFGMRVAKFLDLDTKEKVMSALLEVIPYVGAVYAVTGKRIKIEKGPDGLPRPKLEDLSWTDRGLYLAGEVFVSGHALRGVKEALLKEGVKKVAVEAGKVVAERTGKLLVKRAKQGAVRQLRGTSPSTPNA